MNCLPEKNSPVNRRKVLFSFQHTSIECWASKLNNRKLFRHKNDRTPQTSKSLLIARLDTTWRNINNFYLPRSHWIRFSPALYRLVVALAVSRLFEVAYMRCNERFWYHETFPWTFGDNSAELWNFFMFLSSLLGWSKKSWIKDLLPHRKLSMPIRCSQVGSWKRNCSLLDSIFSRHDHRPKAETCQLSCQIYEAISVELTREKFSLSFRCSAKRFTKRNKNSSRLLSE